MRNETLVLQLMRIFIWIYALLSAAYVFSFDIGEDISGASDYPGFARFAHSKIVSYEAKDKGEYRLALGTLKKVNDLLVPEYERRLEADVTRITYQVPKGERSDLIFAHYRQQIENLKADLLFECHGRDCGSSNHWANNIFRSANLYGPDRYQHYLVAKAHVGDKDIILVVYCIQRGNRRLYAQIDILETSMAELRRVEMNPATLLDQLKANGRLVLGNIEFDENDQLTDESSANLELVAKALGLDVRLSVYVVGHLYGNATPGLMLKRSQIRAQQVQEVLVNIGIAIDRLSAHGVGPLAPLPDESSLRNRVELVVVQTR